MSDLKSQLHALLNKVPPSVNSGSVQYVQQFKDAVARGQKVYASKTAKDFQIQAACSQLQKFWRDG